MGILIFFGLVIFVLFIFSINYKNNKKENYREIIRKYDNINKRLAERKKESDKWEKEWDKLRETADKAREYEKKDIEKALEYHLKSYEFGHNSEILNLNNYAHNIKRAIILFGKLKRYSELKDFLEKVISQYPEEHFAKDWIVRLTKLNSKLNKTAYKRKPLKDIKETPKVQIQEADDADLSVLENIGKQIQDLKNSFPEFDFYYKLKDNESTMTHYSNIPIDRSKTADLRNFRDIIDTLIKKGRVYENNQEYEKAINLYQRIINENIENKEPYKRLMIIYRKLKQKEKEIHIVKDAISFFSNLRNTQKEYVLGLAKKYGKEDFALNYINNNKRIQYYMGTFDLYNPNSDIEKWKERLNKLERK